MPPIRRACSWQCGAEALWRAAYSSAPGRHTAAPRVGAVDVGGSRRFPAAGGGTGGGCVVRAHVRRRTAIAPGFSCIYGIVGAVSPATSSIESFSWVASGIQVGAAIGAAVGGFLVQLVGPRLAFVCAGGCGLATAILRCGAPPPDRGRGSLSRTLHAKAATEARRHRGGADHRRGCFQAWAGWACTH